MLSPKKQEAALLLAQGVTAIEIGKRLHKSERTIVEWKALASIHAAVAAHRALWAKELQDYGLAQQSRRLQDLQLLYDSIWQVIRARAEARGMENVAGGSTGLMVREPWKTHTEAVTIPAVIADPAKKQKAEPERIEYHTRTHYRAKADLALVQELREIQKQIAIELGQWTENRKLSGKVTGVVTLDFSAEVIALARTLSPEQLATYRVELEKQAAAETAPVQ